MIFLVVLGLSAVLGVQSEYNCSAGPPPCLRDDPFSSGLFAEHVESGKILPSNEFLTKVCPPALQVIACVKEYDILHCIADEMEEVDLVAVGNSVTEMCNEESDLRKGYAAHVDCVNNIDFPSQACLLALESTLEELAEDEIEGTLEENEVSKACLVLHMFKPCAVEMVEENCGKEAGPTAGTIMRGIENILRCDENSVVEAIAGLNSVIDTVV